MSKLMPNEYIELAQERVQAKWNGYYQPEDYGYDFTDWVSPYTKGANKIGGIAIVLQDWTSSDAIEGTLDPEIQEYGRTLELKTNKKLEDLLQRIFRVGIKDVYGTNVFPFIKTGSISNHIPIRDIRKAATQFLKREIEIVEPKVVLALGRLAYTGLQSASVNCIHLPHPAARIGTVDKHEKIWREKLS